jgi:hypothetical protein
MTKYGAIRTEVDNITFASKSEARRYAELKIMLAAGEIDDLELQPQYPIIVNGVKVCTYVADFRYIDRGGIVVEDTKGVRTAVYRLKAKLLYACYGITVQEVTA